MRRQEEAFFGSPEGRSIPRPVSRLLAECSTVELYTQLAAKRPFMVVYPYEDRGHAKYFIEDAAQLTSVFQFVDERPNIKAGQKLEYREFIDSPSDWYTTYRAVVTPTGAIIAAALRVSSHDKQSGQIITEDRLYETYESDNDLGQLKASFEHRYSSYFLSSRDVRNNFGYFIPLSGPNAELPVGKKDAKILREHGVDPENRRLPDNIARIATTMALKCVPALCVAATIDMIVDKDLNGYFLERNLDLGGALYVACGLSLDPVSGADRMRQDAIATLHPDDRRFLAEMDTVPVRT